MSNRIIHTFTKLVTLSIPLIALSACDLRFLSGQCDGIFETSTVVHTYEPTTHDLLAVSGWQGRRVVAVGEGGTLLGLTPDGWLALESPTSATLHGIAIGEPDSAGVFPAVIVGEQGAMFRGEGTVQSLSWTAIDTGGATFVDVHTDGHHWVAVGDGVISSSSDGLSWSAVSLAKPATLRAVGGLDDVFWAVGDAGAAFVSEDGGLNWAAVAVDSEVDLTGVWVSESGVRIVGDQGLVLERDEGASSFTHTSVGEGRLGGVYETLVIDDTGALLELEGGDAVPLHEGDATLRAIDDYVAVGDDGLIVMVSEDGSGGCG